MAARDCATWITSSAARASEHGDVARRAFSRFGKGRHRAGLNYGDCFSYALAIVTGEPLLFTGDDFVHTDVSPVDICSRVTDRLMTRR
jgi:uncharacterized protein with PIN domain